MCASAFSNGIKRGDNVESEYSARFFCCITCSKEVPNQRSIMDGYFAIAGKFFFPNDPKWF